MVCLVWLVVKHRHTCMELRSCCYSCRATGSRDSQSQQQYHGCIHMTGGWGYVCYKYIDSVASKCYQFKLISYAYIPIDYVLWGLFIHPKASCLDDAWLPVGIRRSGFSQKTFITFCLSPASVDEAQ